MTVLPDRKWPATQADPDRCRVILGDMREVLAAMEPESVDVDALVWR